MRARRRGGPAEIGNADHGRAELGRVENTRLAHHQRDRNRYLCRRLADLAVLEGLAGTLVFLAHMSHGLLAVPPAMVGATTSWHLFRIGAPDETLLSGRAWEAARAKLADTLRGSLDHHWAVAWDRRVLGIDRPLTLIVGPPGLIGIWIPEPGWEMVPPERIADQLSLAMSANSIAYVIPPQAALDKSEALVRQISCATVSFSPGDVSHWTGTVKEQTLPEVSDLKMIG